jgi:hypothetical protein
MKKFIVIFSLTIMLASLLSGCSLGREFQYQMELREVKIDPEKVVLHEWIGRGDLITEDFTVGTYPEGVHVWMSNNPDSDEWQDGTGVLQIILHNKSTGKSSEIENTYRPWRNTVGIREPGTYSLEIKSANTRWIIRIWIEKDADIFVNLTAGAYGANQNVETEGLPLGCEWIIYGELSAQTSSGNEPMANKTIWLEEQKNDNWERTMSKQTESEQRSALDPNNPNLVTVAHYWFNMPEITVPGEHIYYVVFDGDDTYARAQDDIIIKTTRKAFLKLTGPETAYVGGSFKIEVELKDYLEDQPIISAPVNLKFFDKKQTKWYSWQNIINTDESGKASIDLGEHMSDVLPEIGDWKIKASFPGGRYNNVDYKPVESPASEVVFEKGRPKIELTLLTYPTVSFETFKIKCTLQDDFGRKATGYGIITLWATKAGNKIPMPFGVWDQSSGEQPVIFPIKLESGSYEFWAEYSGDKAYNNSTTSQKLPVAFNR